MLSIAEVLSRNTVEAVIIDHCLKGSPAAATTAFIKTIFETPSIREVCLMHNGCGNSIAKVTGLTLKENTGLNRLVLTANEIGPVELKHWLKACVGTILYKYCMLLSIHWGIGVPWLLQKPFV